MEIQIPDYITVGMYKKLSALPDDMSDLDKRLSTISIVINKPIDEIKSWPVTATVELYKTINDLIATCNPEFYPVIEWNDKQYGFRPIHKMLLDEYIDFEQLAKETDKNINQILSIIFRPIVKNKLPEGTFTARHTYKIFKGEMENGFDYYDIEKYDHILRKQESKQYDDFPASIALGAMAFFLDSKTQLLNNTQFFFPQWNTLIKTEKKSRLKRALHRITVGYISSINLVKVPSYKLQAINV